MSAKTFFTEYWQQKVVVLPGHDAGVRYPNLVPAGAELAAMIPSTSTHKNRLNKGVPLRLGAQLSLARTTAEKGQQPFPYSDVQHGTGDGDALADKVDGLIHQDGWSCILNKLYSFWKPTYVD